MLLIIIGPFILIFRIKTGPVNFVHVWTWMRRTKVSLNLHKN